MVLYQDKRRREFAKMNTLLCILGVLAQIGGVCAEHQCKSASELYDSLHYYKDITNCAILEKAKKTFHEYSALKKSLKLIKDLTLGATDVIVQEEQDEPEEADISNIDWIYIYSYAEEKDEKGRIEKKAVSSTESKHQVKKRVLIPLPTIDKKEVYNRRIEEAEKIKKRKNPFVPWEKIEQWMGLLSTAADVSVYKTYASIIKNSRNIRFGNSLFICKKYVRDWLESRLDFKFPHDAAIYNMYCKLKAQHEGYIEYRKFIYIKTKSSLLNEILQKKASILREIEQIKIMY